MDPWVGKTPLGKEMAIHSRGFVRTHPRAQVTSYANKPIPNKQIKPNLQAKSSPRPLLLRPTCLATHYWSNVWDCSQV